MAYVNVYIPFQNFVRILYFSYVACMLTQVFWQNMLLALRNSAIISQKAEPKSIFSKISSSFEKSEPGLHGEVSKRSVEPLTLPYETGLNNYQYLPIVDESFPLLVSLGQYKGDGPGTSLPQRRLGSPQRQVIARHVGSPSILNGPSEVFFIDLHHITKHHKTSVKC